MTSGDGGIVGGGSASAQIVSLDEDAGVQMLSMTNVSCSFDGDNNRVRSFEGRYCVSAGRCYTLRLSPSDGGTGGIEMTRRPDGGFLERGVIGDITTRVTTDPPPPTARININSGFGFLTITGCPAS